MLLAQSALGRLRDLVIVHPFALLLARLTLTAAKGEGAFCWDHFVWAVRERQQRPHAPLLRPFFVEHRLVPTHTSITHPAKCLAEHIDVEGIWALSPRLYLSVYRLNRRLINPTLR
jgi:hypothetical protein